MLRPLTGKAGGSDPGALPLMATATALGGEFAALEYRPMAGAARDGRLARARPEFDVHVVPGEILATGVECDLLRLVRFERGAGRRP